MLLNENFSLKSLNVKRLNFSRIVTNANRAATCLSDQMLCEAIKSFIRVSEESTLKIACKLQAVIEALYRASFSSASISVSLAENPFVCDWPGCGASYKQKQSLYGHSRLHYADPDDLKCKVCGRTFTQKSSVSLHHRLVHSGE